MPKHNLKWFLPVLVLAKSGHAVAFDPFTIAIATQGAQSMMSQVDEAANTGFALTDLFSELGIETDSEKTLQSAVDRISKINNEARELKGNSEDLKETIGQDLANGKNLTDKINALRSSIRTSKQIAALMGLRPKAADSAVKIQQISLDSKMLEELEAIRRGQYLAYLEDHEAKLKREVFLREILNEQSGLGHIKVPGRERSTREKPWLDSAVELRASGSPHPLWEPL